MEYLRAGFVLVGGRSSRMGADKALLPFHGLTLAGYVAGQVAEAASTVCLVGDPACYGHLGFPVVADNYPGQGPLAGIEAALSASRAEWNLVVACDMPGVSAVLFRQLLDAAVESGADCLIPQGPTARPEPLCAVYRSSCLDAVRDALRRDVRKVTAALAGLRSASWNYPESPWFQNVNTPGEWAPYRDG
ncbi:MAG: molybdenum cofactor guanylyltransferase [Bryobacteraceae bacterium]